MSDAQPETPGYDLSIRVDGSGARPIAPTDVAQFIRLEQCERYLRLRLHERAAGSRFIRDYGVVPQSIPPLLTQSGARFEDITEAAISACYTTVDFGQQRRKSDAHDNERMLDLIRGLGAGEKLVLFQPRVQATVGGWRIRGDVDIIRAERCDSGDLHILIADMKSSTAGKLEHRLQVAFYIEMLDALLQESGIDCAEIGLGVLYRGSVHGEQGLSDEEAARREQHMAAARDIFGVETGYLEVVDPDSYREAVQDLVTGAESVAAQVVNKPFQDVPYHLTYKCDGCLYNEFCMKWSAEHDDLSLLPHVTMQDKGALQRAGIRTTRGLAELKTFTPPDSLMLTPGMEDLHQQLAATWPVGPRLDELVHRALRYRKWKGDPVDALSYIPSKGYGSLPYTDAGHNPNLVTVYIDAQHDYLHDRLYMIGSMVVAHEQGEPARRQQIVHLADGPPDTAEREEQLLLRWVEETIAAVVALAAPDENGMPRAPIHLVFFNRFEQRLLLDALARHFNSILGTTPLYDFITQMAAFDSPVATFLDQEIRELKNYPMICQSLQAVAAYLRFDWNQQEPFRDIFRTRMFDFWRKLDGVEEQAGWYTGRSRFNSQIPLEYAYSAWHDLPDPEAGSRDEFAPYRQSTADLLQRFHARRLEAMEHIAGDFLGNKQTVKTPFSLPDLSSFSEQAPTLAHALMEFVTIERHVAMAAWKSARLAPPERRVLSGETLIARYYEDDQTPDMAAANRENVRRWKLKQEYESQLDGEPLSKEQKEETAWSHDGFPIRLRLESDGIDCSLDEALALSTIRPGDILVVCPRFDIDSRSSATEAVRYTPTPKQMLYAARARLERIEVKRDSSGKAIAATLELVMRDAFGGPWTDGFAFGSFLARPLQDGGLYTLDPDPNNWYGYWALKVSEGLINGGGNALYDRLVDPDTAIVDWPEAAIAGQQRFLNGLEVLHEAGALHPFEPSKRDYIGGHGDAPVLLVQGPPGTGKSYATAFAVLARMQGAMAAGLDFRVFMSCKTHAATDVLLHNLVSVQKHLREVREEHRDVFDRYIDSRVLDVPVFRLKPRGDVADGVIPLPNNDGTSTDRQVWDAIAGQQWCVVAATPGGVYGLVKDRWGTKRLFGNTISSCLVLDETSQMNLPEAMMAALPLEASGQLIVVGDHRQMPPIIHHAWENEPRRTFSQFRTYQSLFLALLEHEPAMIQFEESFRLHADMADFLRREIYSQDGIDYFSRKSEVLPAIPLDDPFVASVLAPEHSLVVIVHDEAASQVRNQFEHELITPILVALVHPETYALDPEDGLGVVVPHRAQRAALQDSLPILSVVDPETGEVRMSAVDTVERFQGGERNVILVSATESDRDYLLNTGKFLLDPRRLTVALSRARQKMVLVASLSVFNLFSTDEEIFHNSLLWKHLLRRTCTHKLWEGERHGHHVTVWGNANDATFPARQEVDRRARPE